MLKLNGTPVTLGNFPDGTLLLKQSPGSEMEAVIDWRYESDNELFALCCLTKHLQKFGIKVSLFMPYIPNARMDRVKENEDVFTLKYFAEIINSLSFTSVTVLDPHSSVSEALIERIRIIRPDKFIRDVVDKINSDGLLMFYPDEGAMKRYCTALNVPYTFGVKNRYWKTGKILSLDIMGEKDAINGSDILIVDDICSKGYTFYFAAQALKKLGARNIYLYVTHCEDNILNGEVLTCGWIEKVYTTNSICKVEHEKVEVLPL